jgi:hypothetical protein
MKKIILGLLLSAAVVSCNNDYKDEFKTQVNTKNIDKEDPIISNLLERGVKIENIEEFNDYYLVEKDIKVDKSFVNPEGKSNSVKQLYSNSLVYLSKANSMTIYIDRTLIDTDNYIQAITSAVNQWNNISDCRINFTIVTDVNADITIKGSDSLPAGVLGMAYVPNSGKPGRLIQLRTNLTVAASALSNVVIHELGHTLGFLHTNGHSVGEYGGNLVPNTYNSDPYSIMNATNNPNNYLTFYDIISARYLYPETYTVNNLIQSPTEDLIYGSSLVDLYWLSNILNEGQVNLKVYIDDVLKEDVNINNTGNYKLHLYSGEIKLRLSSIVNSNIYDEETFYFTLD